jgi:tetratricopeptide (TPR) repeat protein
LKQPDTPGRHPQEWMFCILPVTALVFCLIYLAQIGGQPFFKYLVANPLVYDSEARQLVAGTPPGHPFFLSALYPAFVALVYGLSGGSRLALAVVQGLMMAVSVWLLGRMARHVVSAWAALGACLGITFYWSFYYFAGEMVPATLFVALMLAGMVLFLERDRKPSIFAWATVAFAVLASLMYAAPGIAHLGDLLGGKALPRPAGTYWAGLAFLAVLVAGALACTLGACRWRGLAGSGNLAAGGFTLGASALAWSGSMALVAVLVLRLLLEKGRRTAAAVLTAGFLLPILASLTHNLIVSGDFVPVTTSFGVNLFIGNNAASDGMDPFKFGEGNRVRIEADRLRLSGKQRSDFFTAQARKYIGQHPARWVRLEGRKLLISVAATQVNNNADIAERRAAWKQFFVPILGFGIIFPLAAAGAVAAARENRKALLLAAGYASFLAIPLVFFACERFRLPGIALLIPLAAYGCEALVRYARRKKFARLALLAVAIAVAAAVSNVDFLGLKTYEMPSITANKAYVARLAGNREETRTLARRALALDPRSAGALFQLGALAQEERRPVEALTYYLECLEADPYFVAAYEAAGAILDAVRITRSYLDAYVNDLMSGGGDYRQARANLIDFVKSRVP